jgi:hypothetical protein
MPDAPFATVPDWTSWENQGAGVAVADLGGTGTQDLLVLRVDAPRGGPNRASYRVGSGLDAVGAVTRWGPWLDVPGWDSNQDEGAALAVAELGPSGLCLIVLQVRGGGDAAANNGRYRIGRTLDEHGIPQGGWSPWRDVPDWRSFRDQGAGIAVADLGSDGRPELVVFHVDDTNTDRPDLPNRAFYRIGHALA